MEAKNHHDHSDKQLLISVKTMKSLGIEINLVPCYCEAMCMTWVAFQATDLNHETKT